MRLFLAKHPLLRKLLVAFGIVLIFITGRYLPLPGVALGAYVNLNPFLDTAISLTGGSLSQIGLFSLGLAPMMYANLLVQLFSLGKRHTSLSPKLLEFRKNLLLLVIAFVQGMTVAVSLTYGRGDGFLLMALQATAVLIAGAFVINWLSNMNSAYGIGGPMLIMLTSLLFNQLSNLPLLGELWQEGYQFLILGFGLWTLLTIFLIVYFDKAEYRIPIQRMSIHNNYASSSYLPIKVNVVGGMPIMYAYSLLSFPQYLLVFLAFLFPSWQWLQGLNHYFMMTNWVGILIYLLILVILSVMMGFVTVDVVSLAEGMRHAGDYIPYIRTGKPTQLYLSRFVWFFSLFNACYLVVLSGLPLLVSLLVPKVQPLAGLTGVFMMMGGILIQLLDEFRVMRLKKQYVSLFD